MLRIVRVRENDAVFYVILRKAKEISFLPRILALIFRGFVGKVGENFIIRRNSQMTHASTVPIVLRKIPNNE